jgi:cell division protein FtsZ
VLLSISGGSDLGLFEINEAAQLVSNAAAPDANIIFGAVIDDALGDEVRVTVIAAGFDEGRPPTTHTAHDRGAASGLQDNSARPSTPARSVSPAARSAAPPSTVVSEAASRSAAQPAPAPAPPPAAPAGPTPAGSAGVPAEGATAAAAAAASETAPAPEAPAKKRTSVPAPPEFGSGPLGAEHATRPKVPRPAGEPSPLAASDGHTGRDGGTEGAGSFATSWKEPTRRRPVVFDEDDDLDVPDFLK